MVVKAMFNIVNFENLATPSNQKKIKEKMPFTINCHQCSKAMFVLFIERLLLQFTSLINSKYAIIKTTPFLMQMVYPEIKKLVHLTQNSKAMSMKFVERKPWKAAHVKVILRLQYILYAL